MSAAAPTFPALDSGHLPIPAAVFEILAYLIVVSVSALAFVSGSLTINGAVILTVLLLSTLIVLSWVLLDRGRHPCFLFLCALALFQGGRLIAYCLGNEPDPMQVVLMTPNPFNLTRDEQGLTLLCLALSAICVYAPCRVLYRPVAPPSDVAVQKYLPYLYILFAATLPVQLFKNYRYYDYAQQHGGYTFIFVNHSALASSVPLWARMIPLITFPVFVAIFVFERRKSPLYLATFLYFSTASLILLLGSRGGTFLLVAALWWVARVKALRKTRMIRLVVVVLALLLIADVVQEQRKAEQAGGYQFSPINLIDSQGVSLNVTGVALKYRALFSPYFGSYMLRELQNAFVASDASNYYRGRALGFDISVLLDPEGFEEGYGTSSSYLAEAYVGGGLISLVLVSVALGMGLHAFYKFSGNTLLLFLFALSLPEILLLPRGELLDWMSVLARNGILILSLLAGWAIYRLITSIQRSPAGG